MGRQLSSRLLGERLWPSHRAAVAHFMAEKYRFTHRAVPGIRAALGLDAAEVRESYQRLYSEPLDTIYVRRVNLAALQRGLLRAACISHLLPQASRKPARIAGKIRKGL